MTREMKESGISWIGKIPEIWSLIRLKYLVNIETGDSDTQDADPDGEYNFYVRSPIIEHSSHYTFSGDSILMAGDGVGAGKVFHYATGKYAVHQRVYCLHDFSPAVNPQFLFLYLSNRFPMRVEQGSAKSTVDSIRLPMLKDFPVLLPSIDEQERIVEFLKEKYYTIDSLASNIQKEIETLEAYKKSLITEAVTKGLDISVPMKSSGNPWIGKIPTTWVLSKVKYVSSVVTDGAHVSPDYVDDGYEFISTVNVIDGAINFENCIHTSESSYKVFVNTGCKPRRGDVLISKDGTVGKTVIIDYDREFVIGSSLVIIRPVCNKINQRFLNYNLQAKYTQQLLQLIMHGSALKRVSVQKNSNLPLTLPPLNEQVSIADYLDDKCSEVDAIIASKKQQLETLATYKKSLIYEYVTGKKEVK